MGIFEDYEFLHIVMYKMCALQDLDTSSLKLCCATKPRTSSISDPSKSSKMSLDSRVAALTAENEKLRQNLETVRAENKQLRNPHNAASKKSKSPKHVKKNSTSSKPKDHRVA